MINIKNIFKKIKTFFKRKKKVPRTHKDAREIQLMIRDNICQSLDFMDFHNGFNFHEDQNMLKLYINMLYFDYIIDDVDPNIFIEIDGDIKKEIQEHINLKKEEDMEKQIIH